MALITVPNVSEGRDPDRARALADSLTHSGCRLLDVHSDAAHNRSVFTAVGSAEALVDGLSVLAERAANVIDLERHRGVHPRLGALDVCPIVPEGEPMDNAAAAARAVAAAIADRAGLPVYLYGAASTDRNRELPAIRRGGLADLIGRAAAGFAPDFGPREIDPRRGVVCVGARGVLIAFNVWISGSIEIATTIAAEVRERGGGLPGVRALGLELSRSETQVSMNLTAPERTGIDEAFDAVSRIARQRGSTVLRTEIVGLVPERFLPSPDAEAARLLLEPGRSLESVLIA
jgi:glutamate formiminotransferase / 5-formyltetrahydrofolate cyclo-ligase